MSEKEKEADRLRERLKGEPLEALNMKLPGLKNAAAKLKEEIKNKKGTGYLEVYDRMQLIGWSCEVMIVINLIEEEIKTREEACPNFAESEA